MRFPHLPIWKLALLTALGGAFVIALALTVTVFALLLFPIIFLGLAIARWRLMRPVRMSIPVMPRRR